MRNNPGGIAVQGDYYFDIMAQDLVKLKKKSKLWVYDENGRIYTEKRNQKTGENYRVYFYPRGSYSIGARN